MDQAYLDRFDSRRSSVYARHGMVAASNPLAAVAGLRLLMSGGNAADAAVATAAALNVVEPTSTGIGGDCFALFYHASTRQLTALNGSGRAPTALTLDMLERQGLAHKLPPTHAHTVTVPGACAAWSDLLERHGRLPLSESLAPAIRLAEEGFPVSPVTSYWWKRGAGRQLTNSPGGQELTIDGRGPEPGEIMRLPTLARTLRIVAEGGKESFYTGEFAGRIAETVQAHGGVLTVEDLASHQSTWEDPISTTYRGIRIWECPPNGQGLAALIALNVLEGYDLKGMDPLGPERLHLLVEALRLGFADAQWYVSDLAFNDIPLQALLSKEYAGARRKLIQADSSLPPLGHGVPAAGADTVYLTVVDGEGNACSLINSLYMGFGTGIVPPGTGMSLQNRGYSFSHDQAHPNALAPGKRPYHTIIPAMATYARDDALFASFGVMGGTMQPQGHVQVVVGLVDDGLDPQQALDRPRFCLTLVEPQTITGEDGRAFSTLSLFEDKPSSQVQLESGVPAPTLARLNALGHPIHSVNGYARSVFGRGQIILRDPETGVQCGGSDPRADGMAVGW